MASYHEKIIAQLQALKGHWRAIAPLSGSTYSTLAKIAQGHERNPKIASLEKLERGIAAFIRLQNEARAAEHVLRERGPLLLKSEALKHFGSHAAIGRALGITGAAVRYWKVVVPKKYAQRVQDLMRGSAQANPVQPDTRIGAQGPP